MVRKEVEYYSNNENSTGELGKIIGSLADSGQILLLAGDLGAGKTLLAKAICQGLGVEEDVTSPTYTLINEYNGNFKVYHMDLYRLETADELFELGIEDFLAGDGVVIIEWPELVFEFLPPDFVYIKIIKKNDHERRIEIKAEGNKSEELLRSLANIGEIDINVSTGD